MKSAVVVVAVALFGINFSGSAIAPSPKPNPTSVHRILTATAKRPLLVIPGDAINVVLPEGKLSVLLVGPKIPPNTSAEVLSGTFYFNFHQLSGSSIIDIHDFGILDGNATLIRPVAFDDGRTKVLLHSGQKLAVSLTELMAVGTGTLRWAPLKHYVADWQFVEETA